jgi:hypothetical protein
MPTGKPLEGSRKMELIGNAGIVAVFAGGLAMAFSGCSTHISEKDAVCLQTGPTSFQIIDVQVPAKPLVLWDAQGDYDRSNGVVDRKHVKAFVDIAYGDPEIREATMDLQSGTCGVSNRSRFSQARIMKHFYKLEKHP